MKPQHPPRRHDIDALRVLAFGLLILYHVGMFYVPWDWHVKSVHEAQWLETPMLVLNQWRMPLLFLLSGLAVHFLLEKVPAATFAWRRIVRLGLPLLFGMAVVVPPQAWVQALYNGAFQGGYGEFLVAYFTFQPWPEGAFDGSDVGVTWNHLWYLPYLLCYTLAALPLFAWLRGPGARVARGFAALRGPWLVVLPIAPLFAAGWFVFPSYPYIDHGLLNDWYAHAMYGTIFVYGYLIGRDAGMWCELARLRWWTLGLACAAFPAYRWVVDWAGEDPSGLQDVAVYLAVYLNRWAWLLAVLGWGHVLLNRPFRWLPYASEAVYPWYILHQTFIVAGGYALSNVALGPVLEPALLIALTLGGCAVLHAGLIRRIAWLRPLFGLKQARADGLIRPAAAPARAKSMN